MSDITRTIHILVPGTIKGRWVRASRMRGMSLTDWIVEIVEQHLEDDDNDFETTESKSIPAAELKADESMADDIPWVEMEKFTLTVDDKPDICFSGEMIARVTSKTDESSLRWTELVLYKTTGGQFVCYLIGRTLYKGEHDRFNAKVCGSIDGVRKFFRYGWLAKQLYFRASIHLGEVFIE